MAKKKNKKVKAAFDIKTEKRVKTLIQPESYATKNPSWKFSILDCAGLECLFAVDAQIFWESVLPRLKEAESMTWAAIDDGKHNHYLTFGNLIRTAQKRLMEIAQDDTDSLYQIGFTGKQRLIGIRDAETLKIIWWDSEHQVCPSTKK